MDDTRPAPSDGAPTYLHFIGGAGVPSGTGRTFESRNPADRRDLVGRFQAGDAADVARAIAAAGEAAPGWRATPAPRRGEILYRQVPVVLDEGARRGELILPIGEGRPRAGRRQRRLGAEQIAESAQRAACPCRSGRDA